MNYGLSEKEKNLCKALKPKWICRDKNGGLFAFTAKPVKNEITGFWEVPNDKPCSVTDLGKLFEDCPFAFVKWEDPEAVNISDLVLSELPEEIAIPIEEGRSLKVYINQDPDYFGEITICLADHNNLIVQDLVMVRPYRDREDRSVDLDKGYEILIWGDSTSEDYSDEYLIKDYFWKA